MNNNNNNNSKLENNNNFEDYNLKIVFWYIIIIIIFDLQVYKIIFYKILKNAKTLSLNFGVFRLD